MNQIAIECTRKQIIMILLSKYILFQGKRYGETCQAVSTYTYDPDPSKIYKKKMMIIMMIDDV